MIAVANRLFIMYLWIYFAKKSIQSKSFYYLCTRFSRKSNLGKRINNLIIKRMATKIRLQRHGRKGYAYYHVVVADSRSPRDGRCIERLGTYNPNTHPATINLNFERALYWVGVGAQPTDTANMILKKEGVLYKKHLLGGVRKGAFDEATAEQKFEAWKREKADILTKQQEKAKSDKAGEANKRLDAEKAKNKARAEAVAKKLAEAKLAEQQAAAEAAESEAQPEATEESTTEAKE